MHTILKCLRNAKRVENPYEALEEICKKHDNLIAFVMPDSFLENTKADVIVPHSDIRLERLNTDMKYETLEINKGTILGVYPGDIFFAESYKVTVTPFYIGNAAREILTRYQYKKKHRIFNIPLYSEEYLKKEFSKKSYCTSKINDKIII